MFKKIFSAFCLILVVVAVLSACGETAPPEVEIISANLSETETAEEIAAELTAEEVEILVEEMPEIVFVKYLVSYSFPKPALSGYFIDNKGNIKYFEFDENEFIDDIIDSTFGIPNLSFEEYLEYRNLNEFHQNLKESEVETISDPILYEDLTECYKLLLKVDRDSNLKRVTLSTPAEEDYRGIYGVILNENNEEILIPIKDWGEEFYTNEDFYYTVNEDSYVVKLYRQLKSVSHDLFYI